jgi:Cytochrome C oxidase, cbb3-type, subunit III
MQKTRVFSLRRPASRAALCISLIGFPLAAQPVEEPMPGDYRVVEGKVDPGTYTGWRLFHTTCYGCHGVGGGGTDLAPNLLERIKTLTPRGFATKVLTSYRIVLPETDVNGSDASAVREAMIEDIMRRRRNGRGQVVMPAWRSDSSVSPHVLDLYAYLLARSDGALGPGEPLLMTAKKSTEKAP